MLVTDLLLSTNSVPSFGEGPNVKRSLVYSNLRRQLAPTSPLRLTRLRPLRCSRLSPGVFTTMSRSDSLSTPMSSVSLVTSVPACPSWLPGGRGLPWLRTSLFPPSRRQPRDGSLCTASHYFGMLAFPYRRIAFTFVSGWSLLSTLHRLTSRWTAVFCYGGCCTLTQVPPTGFQPARYVRCKAHQSRPSPTAGVRTDFVLV